MKETAGPSRVSRNPYFALFRRDRGSEDGAVPKRPAPRIRAAPQEGDGPGREHTYSDFELFRRVFQDSRPYWPHLVGIFALGLLSMPLALLAPVGLKIAVDSVIGSHPLPSFLGAVVPSAVTSSDTAVLFLAAALIVAVALLTRALGITESILAAYTGEKLVLDLRTRLLAHLQRLSLSYHDAKESADSIYRVQNDTFAIRNLPLDGLAPVVTATVTVIGMLYVTVRIDWQLAVIAFWVGPVLAVIGQRYRRRLRSQSLKMKQLESSALSVVHEMLSAIRLVQAFGQEEREHARPTSFGPGRGEIRGSAGRDHGDGYRDRLGHRGSPRSGKHHHSR
jgi:ATP-binding cassette, subfamily B, bacterial